VTKGKQRKDFFTIPEWEEWMEAQPDKEKWDSKYYKVRASECATAYKI
jgi:DNA topoisomerase II